MCSEVGIRNITLQKIADLAELSFGTVRYCLPPEECDIEIEGFDFVLASAYKYIEATLDYERINNSHLSPLEVYAIAMFDWIAKAPEEGAYLLYMYYSGTTRTASRAKVEVTIQKARSRIEALYLEGKGRNLHKTKWSAKEVAMHVHSLVLGHAFIALASRNKTSFLAEKAQCLNAIKLL